MPEQISGADLISEFVAGAASGTIFTASSNLFATLFLFHAEVIIIIIVVVMAEPLSMPP